MSVPRSSRWVAKLWRSVCRESVLRSPAAFAACLNSRPNWRVVSGRRLLRPGNSQRCSGTRSVSYAVGRAFHHCRNRSRTSAGSITCPSLRPLHDADDHLFTVDVARPQPHDLPRPQSATIGEAQHRSRLQARRHDQNTLDLPGAQHGRQLLRFLDVPDLSRQIVATQRDAEQTPHLVRRRCIGRTLQPGGEPLAARNVAALSVRVELACSHVVDHALTQRTDSSSVAHGEFHLSEVDDTSILRTRSPRRYGRPLNWLPASRLLPRVAGWSAATLCFGASASLLDARRKSADRFESSRSPPAAGAAPLSRPALLRSGATPVQAA